MSDPRDTGAPPPDIAAHEAAALAAEDEDTKLWRKRMAATAAARGVSVLGSGTIRSEDLAAHEAAMRAAGVGPAPAPAPIGPKLPRAAAVATGDKRPRRVLIQREDVRKTRGKPPPPVKGFMSAVREKIAAVRRQGDVLLAIAVELAGYLRGISGDGSVQRSYKELAARIGHCRETIRKAILLVERAAIFDVLNVRERRLVKVAGVMVEKVVNARNLYIPRLPDELDEPEAPDPEAPPLDDATKLLLQGMRRFAATLQRQARRTGLFARTLGLNTTPLKSRRLYREPEGEPAPT